MVNQAERERIGAEISSLMHRASRDAIEATMPKVTALIPADASDDDLRYYQTAVATGLLVTAVFGHCAIDGVDQDSVPAAISAALPGLVAAYRKMALDAAGLTPEAGE